jgi:hypothetical protein
MLHDNPQALPEPIEAIEWAALLVPINDAIRYRHQKFAVVKGADEVISNWRDASEALAMVGDLMLSAADDLEQQRRGLGQ